MTGEDLMNKILEKQKDTRSDIRALGTGINRLCTATEINSDLLRQVLAFQEAQDERDAMQGEIAKDTARMAHSIATLVESLYGTNQELVGLIKELRLHLAADKTLESTIARFAAAGIVIDERLK